MPHLFKGSSFDTVFSISACVSTLWLLFYLAVYSCSLFFAPLSVWCSQRGFCGTPRGGWALNQQKRSCCTKAEKNKIAIKYLTKSHIAGSLLIIFSLFFALIFLNFLFIFLSNLILMKSSPAGWSESARQCLAFENHCWFALRASRAKATTTESTKRWFWFGEKMVLAKCKVQLNPFKVSFAAILPTLIWQIVLFPTFSSSFTLFLFLWLLYNCLLLRSCQKKSTGNSN